MVKKAIIAAIAVAVAAFGFLGWRWYWVNLAETPAYASFKVCATNLAMGRLQEAEGCAADDASRLQIRDVYNMSNYRLADKVISIAYHREAEVRIEERNAVHITAVQRVIFDQEGRAHYDVRYNATVISVGAAWRVSVLNYDFLGFGKTGY